MTDLLMTADAYRYGSAIAATIAFFLLVVALLWRGDLVPSPWRLFLVSVATQQAVIAYVTVVRAVNTPPTFPGAEATPVDLGLVALMLSGVAVAGSLAVVLATDAGLRD